MTISSIFIFFFVLLQFMPISIRCLPWPGAAKLVPDALHPSSTRKHATNEPETLPKGIGFMPSQFVPAILTLDRGVTKSQQERKMDSRVLLTPHPDHRNKPAEHQKGREVIAESANSISFLLNGNGIVNRLLYVLVPNGEAQIEQLEGLLTIHSGNSRKSTVAVDQAHFRKHSEPDLRDQNLPASTESSRFSYQATLRAPQMAWVLDKDGDGVFDTIDMCPDTPRGVKPDFRGCPFDSDDDGIPDFKDHCPRTPVGAFADPRGCWSCDGMTLFDFGKSHVKPRAYALLDSVAAILLKNRDLKLEIQGHTDNRGSLSFNQTLSEKRAQSVKSYLVGKGVDAKRLKAVGYGFALPLASNDTVEGRAKNRRVELRPIY
jgi:flagellar motor protein MotB